jgi:DNA-directed RNA polymerase subunit beta
LPAGLFPLESREFLREHGLFVHRKKRIRKDFGKRPSILEVPFLLATQIDSYRSSCSRDRKAPKSARTSVCMPLSSRAPDRELLRQRGAGIRQLSLGEPVFDVRECQLRGATYAAPLRVLVRLVIYDKDAPAGSKVVKDVKEQEVYMGDCR